MFGNIRSTAALIVAAFLLCAGGRAEAQVVVGGPGYVGAGFPIGNFNPYGYGYGGSWGAGYGASYYTSTFYGAPTVGYFGSGYGFNYLPYGYYRGPWGRSFALPPVVIPAETMFGPLPLQSFLGIGPAVAQPVSYSLPAVNPNPIPAGGGFGVLAPGVKVPKAQLPASNQAARDRAKRQLEIGDDWFRKQSFGNAATAYREAIRAAPDVADAYFHQAAVAIAQGRYDAAIEGIKSGLKISTTYLDAGFKYSTLYGDNRLARQAHLETLAQAATDAPTSDLFYLMGVMLFFDEQPRRSGPFFVKARELAVGETWHIDVFTEILRRMDAAAAEEAVKKGRGADAAGAPPEAHPPKAAAPVRDGAEI